MSFFWRFMNVSNIFECHTVLNNPKKEENSEGNMDEESGVFFFFLAFSSTRKLGGLPYS